MESAKTNQRKFITEALAEWRARGGQVRVEKTTTRTFGRVRKPGHAPSALKADRVLKVIVRGT